jgi:hypothetical protein
MSEFSLLHGSILNSSVWVLGSKDERLVWITILAMKDKDGIVKSSMVGLADRAKVTLEECAAAVKKFLEPDPEDTSKVEEGRRLREVSGGWEVVNHHYYRFSSEERRELWRQQKAAERARKAIELEKFTGGEGKPNRKFRRYTREEQRAAREKENGVKAGADTHENDPEWMKHAEGCLPASAGEKGAG